MVSHNFEQFDHWFESLGKVEMKKGRGCSRSLIPLDLPRRAIPRSHRSRAYQANRIVAFQRLAITLTIIIRKDEGKL